VLPPTKELSIYAQNRRKGIEMVEDPYEQLKKYGTWDMTSSAAFFPDCFFRAVVGEKEQNMVHFRGIIAETRALKTKEKETKHIFFLGVGPQHYIDAEWKDKRPLKSSQWIGMEARASLLDGELHRYVVHEYFLF
jgi:hypothetical protein